MNSFSRAVGTKAAVALCVGLGIGAGFGLTLRLPPARADDDKVVVKADRVEARVIVIVDELGNKRAFLAAVPTVGSRGNALAFQRRER